MSVSGFKINGVVQKYNYNDLDAIDVLTGHIHDKAVTTAKLADGAVETLQIGSKAVTSAKLGDDVLDLFDEKANIDGSYEGMTVGNAEQLVSSVYTEDSVPYTFRTTGGSADVGNRENDTVVGGTVAWNQLLYVPDGSKTDRGVTATQNASTGLITLSDTASASYAAVFMYVPTVINHVYAAVYRVVTNPNDLPIKVSVANISWPASRDICKASATVASASVMVSGFTSGANLTGVTMYANIVDLTQMFGTTIADYLYTLENGTAGAGIAKLKSWGYLTKDYYPSHAASLESVKVSAHKMVGFNAWDEEWEVGGISASTGDNVSQNNTIRAKNYIPVLPNTAYFTFCGKESDFRSWFYLFYYDADKNYIGNSGGYVTSTYPKTFPDNARYMRFQCHANYGTAYEHDICINLHWDGERDGEYEEYKSWNYPLDSSLTLRGIPKLDSSNNLHYDGDVYETDGTVTRKYGTITFDGTQSDSSFGLTAMSGYTQIAYADYNPIGVTNAKFISDKLICSSPGSPGLGNIWSSSSASRMFLGLPDSVTTKAQMQTYFASNPITVVYPIATPTTESADPYTNPQVCDDFGTEEYVDAAYANGNRDFQMPCGHNTEYQNNLRAKLEMSPNSPNGDGLYAVRQVSGENSYEQISIPTGLPTAPSANGTYTLRCTVSGGTPSYSWVSQ